MSIISPLLAQVLNITIAKSVASEGSVNIQLKPGSGANIFTDNVYSIQNRFEAVIHLTPLEANDLMKRIAPL